MSDDQTHDDLPPLELRPHRRLLPELELDLRRSGRRGRGDAAVDQPVPEQATPVDPPDASEPVPPADPSAITSPEAPQRDAASTKRQSKRQAKQEAKQQKAQEKAQRKAAKYDASRRTRRLIRKAEKERAEAERKAAEQQRQAEEKERKESERQAAKQQKAQAKAQRTVAKQAMRSEPATAIDATVSAERSVAAPATQPIAVPSPGSSKAKSQTTSKDKAQADAEPKATAAADEGPKPRKPPLYWRVLRLNHVHPNGWQRALLIEGVLAVAIVLVLAGKATVWTIPVLPVVAAVLVKLNDVLAGSLTGAKSQRADSSLVGRKPAEPGVKSGQPRWWRRMRSTPPPHTVSPKTRKTTSETQTRKRAAKKK